MTAANEPFYDKVDTVSDSPRGENSIRHREHRNASLRRCIAWAPWVIHLTLFLLYLMLYLKARPAPIQKTWPDIFEDFPPANEQRQSLGPKTDTAFHGRPSETLHKAWKDLLSVGVVGISSAEAARLPLHTTKDMRIPNKYVVELNVFHQLHCLLMLRKQVWEPRHLSWQNGEEVGFWEFHMDHCIEHLRLTLMCHADTTPQRFLWDHEHNAYTLPSTQEFKCRDFEAIKDWASQRNTTGLSSMAAAGHDMKDSVSKRRSI